VVLDLLYPIIPVLKRVWSPVGEDSINEETAEDWVLRLDLVYACVYLGGGVNCSVFPDIVYRLDGSSMSESDDELLASAFSEKTDGGPARLKVGDVVWAKVKGYPFWPGIVSL